MNSTIDFIHLAWGKVAERSLKWWISGDVACVVESESWNIYSGICADTGSNCICAEQVALGAMITAWEYRFQRIIAVWKDDAGGIYVIPPCGNCRQFMRELDESNLDSEIIFDVDKHVSLRELLPYHDWWNKIE